MIVLLRHISAAPVSGIPIPREFFEQYSNWDRNVMKTFDKENHYSFRTMLHFDGETEVTVLTKKSKGSQGQT